MTLIFAFSLIYVVLFSVVRALPTPKAHVEVAPEYHQPVHWLTHFGSVIPADTTINLEWEGGSGKGYELYYVSQWDGQEDYYPEDIVTTQATHYEWRTPKASAFPEGTTFVVGVNDISARSLGSTWYDLTGLINFDK